MTDYRRIDLDDEKEVRFVFTNRNGGNIINKTFLLNCVNWNEELKKVIEMIKWLELDVYTCNLRLLTNEELDELDNYDDNDDDNDDSDSDEE
jgi:hypothetical protein